MKHRYTLALVLVLSLVSVVCAQEVAPKKKSPVDPNKFAVIINGAGGEPAYAKQFEQWTTELSTVLSDRYGFDTKQIRVLTEKPADATIARSTAEDVKRTFAALKTQLEADNILFVFLIGHGSFDGKESKFNLVGPDLPASEYNAMLSALPTRRIVVLNMASASGEFIKSLAAKGRIVITATRNGQETNATRFAGFFITALNANDSDTDQDGHTSVLEAFVYANRLTEEFYKRAGRLATEHALIDDNGDGLGTPADWFRGVRATKRARDGAALDGLRAQQMTLVRSAAEQQLSAEMRERRDKLELEIAALRERKGSLDEAAYLRELEKLLLRLAALYEGT